jgi:hypothetical protein
MPQGKRALLLLTAGLIFVSLSGFLPWLHLQEVRCEHHACNHEPEHDSRNCEQCQLYLAMAAEEPLPPVTAVIRPAACGNLISVERTILPAAARYLLPPSRAPPIPL